MTVRGKARETHWRKVFERQARSGLNVASFCRRESVSTAGFYTWRRKLRERDEAAAEVTTATDTTTRSVPTDSQFVPVHLEGVSASPAVTINLANGVRVEVPGGVDQQTVARVFQVLREVSAC